jgi:PIN domain nuclease of toxin-antitoxin system
MPISGQEALGYFRDAGFEVLDIVPAHIVAIETLASLHNDPFDRLLVAQAMAVPLRLLTHDQRVADYSDSIIVV